MNRVSSWISSKIIVLLRLCVLTEGITGRNYSRSVRFNGTGRDLRQREICAPLACICNAYVALAKILFASGVRKLFFSRKDAKAQRRTCSKQVSYCFSGMY